MKLRTRNYMLMAALVCGLAAITVHQAGEIGAADYRVLREGFRHGTPDYRAAIAAAMRSGDVSRWEYRNLLDRYQNRSVMFPVGIGTLNLREERLVLAAMTRQLNHR